MFAAFNVVKRSHKNCRQTWKKFKEKTKNASLSYGISASKMQEMGKKMLHWVVLECNETGVKSFIRLLTKTKEINLGDWWLQYSKLSKIYKMRRSEEEKHGC